MLIRLELGLIRIQFGFELPCLDTRHFSVSTIPLVLMLHLSEILKYTHKLYTRSTKKLTMTYSLPDSSTIRIPLSLVASASALLVDDLCSV